jgi:hypothetical protein
MFCYSEGKYDLIFSLVNLVFRSKFDVGGLTHLLKRDRQVDYTTFSELYYIHCIR